MAEGTAWMASGGSQDLEWDFFVPFWMDFYIPSAAFIRGSTCKAEVIHTAEQTAHSSFIWRGFVQPGFTLPARTRCLAPPRYTTLHLDSNHTSHHFRCQRKYNQMPRGLYQKPGLATISALGHYFTCIYQNNVNME